MRKIKTNEIEVATMQFFGIRENIIVPNISWGFDIHEIDLFIIRKSGYAVEVEIKVSKEDFYRDFKKSHNHIDKGNRIKEFYYAMPDYLYEIVKADIPKTAGIIMCKVCNSRKFNSALDVSASI